MSMLPKTFVILSPAFSNQKYFFIKLYNSFQRILKIFMEIMKQAYIIYPTKIIFTYKKENYDIFNALYNHTSFTTIQLNNQIKQQINIILQVLYIINLINKMLLNIFLIHYIYFKFILPYKYYLILFKVHQNI